jgi:hypothetical protein
MIVGTSGIEGGLAPVRLEVAVLTDRAATDGTADDAPGEVGSGGDFRFGMVVVGFPTRRLSFQSSIRFWDVTAGRRKTIH